jgi:hypothetical protein
MGKTNKQIKVFCKNCKNEFTIRNDTRFRWKGNCGKCASKEISSRPNIKDIRSKNAKIQTLRQGGILNAKKFDGNNCGEKHWNYKGGITPENVKIRTSVEMILWRQSVFARDNWTCQKYGIKGGKLHSHHIQNFSSHPELRFAIDNGITLSEKAHKEFHKKYGIKNNTREQLEDFMMAISGLRLVEALMDNIKEI